MQSARKSGEDGNTDDFLGYIEIPIKVQISPIQTIFIITILTIFMYNQAADKEKRAARKKNRENIAAVVTDRKRGIHPPAVYS